jgi:hypothetical protein
MRLTDSLTWRQSRRSSRQGVRSLAYFLIAAPVLAPLLGRDVIDLVAGIPIGVGILLWHRWRPGPPEHLASVEHVVPHGFYLAWCDCGWQGDDQDSEASARDEAARHAPAVRDGLHAFGV